MSCAFCEKLNRLERLPADELVAQFPNSIALLAPWQYFTGYCILVSRVHAEELLDLPPAVRHDQFDEMMLLATVINQEFRPRKFNYELLGNQVRHPHWHLIPRYESDPDHMQPAWPAILRAENDVTTKAIMCGKDRMEIATRIRSALAKRPINIPV